MSRSSEPTAGERAYAWTKQRILNMSFAGGELISEGEVAGALSLSRTPIREAFLRLEAEGLLRLYPKRGALVVPVSAQDVSDVLEARLLIERFAAQKILDENRSAQVVAAMRAVLAQQMASANTIPLEQLSELDRAFHGTLVQAADNHIVTGLYGSLRDRQLRVSTMVFERDPSRWPTILAQHESICDHLESGSAQALMATMEAHIHGAEDLVSGTGGYLAGEES